MAVKIAKKRKQEKTEDEHPSTSKKKRVEFSISSFRKRLQKEECFQALEEFVKQCQVIKGNDGPAVQFLREGGQLAEIIGVLDGGSSRDPVRVSVVFSALHALLLRILTEVPEQKQSAEALCHHLLSNHLNAIHNLLSIRSAARQKKVVLQLLTVVVTLSTMLARDVLSYVSLTMEVVDKIVESARTDDPKSVRICFIQFLMAFLVEGRQSVIHLLLDKRKILTSIVPGLVYDSSKLVVFVLTTLRTKLVEGIGISKTQKLQVFNTRVMCDLLKLYKWKGPAAFAQKWKRDSRQAHREVLEDRTQQKLVAEAVHALLVLLCTSHRHGIAFHDYTLGTSGNKHNILIDTVLQELKRPWEETLQADLVVQIVRACPELAQLVYRRVGPVLQPRASPSWIKAVNFLIRVVTSINLSALTSLEPSAAVDAAKALAAPAPILSSLASQGLLHEHPAVRQKTAEFLQAVLQGVKVPQTALVGHHATEFDSHIFKLFPSGDILEKSWTMALTPTPSEKNVSETSVPIPKPIGQLSALVKLIFLYQKQYPLLLDISGAQSALTSTLIKVLDLEDDEDEKVLTLKVEVMNLLTFLDTSSLDPSEVRFDNAIAVLLRASCKDTLSVEAQHALGALLIKCRVLEPIAADITGELGIWLHSYQSVSPSHRPTITSFLQDVLVKVARKPTPYVEHVLKAREAGVYFADGQKFKTVAHMNIADQIFQELLGIENIDGLQTQEMAVQENMRREKDDIIKFDFDSLASSVELSALLMCAMDVAAKEKLEAPIKKYLSSVVVHLLHLQEDPRPFLSIAKHWKFMPSAVTEYLISWNGEQPIVLTEPFGSCTPESSLSRLILKPGTTIPELEDCSNPISILLYVRLLTFHIAQLAEKQHLTEQMIAASLDVYLALLHALQQTTSSSEDSLRNRYTAKFFSIILRHSVLLCYFSPLHREKQITENLVTNLLLNFIEKAENFETLPVKHSCIPLKNKIVRNILHYLKKSKHPARTETLFRAVKLLRMTGREMHSVISKLSLKMTLSPWTELLSYLLCNTSVLSYSEVTSLGVSLREYIQNDSDEDSAVWNVADAFQEYLQRFPHCVHYVPSNLFPVTVCKRGVNLASVILHHRSFYVLQLTELVKQKGKDIISSEILCPLLTTASRHGPLSSSLLKTLYKQYQGEILRGMKAPFSYPTCFANHPDIARQLIVECVDSHGCHALCRSLDKNWKNVGLCTHFHLSVICGLRTRGGWRKEAAPLVHMLLLQIKEMLQQKVDSSLIVETCTLLGEHLDDNNIKWSNQEIHSDENWNLLPALILQTGLSGSDPILTSNLFLALSRVLWKANAVLMAERIFEMTVSHSRFLDIVLVQEQAGIKLAVLQLVLTCYKLVPHVMKPAHVPIWLGAYGASLSHSNQVILKVLLCMHDNKNINFNAYRPFLWGEAAINHYSVRSRAGMSLWRVPQATVVLELLESEMIENTIANFPINRILLVGEQEKLLQTENFITGYVESLEPSQPDIYDPAFIVPLMSHILAPESVVQDYKFSRSGGLALTLETLGSKCEHMRAAALSVLCRYHNRLESRNAEAKLHGQFIETIRTGIRNLKFFESRSTSVLVSEKEKLKSTDSTHVTEDKILDGNTSTSDFQFAPKIPNLSATFLARASLVLTNPLHTLYSRLHKFILAKPALDLWTVQELQELLRPGTVHFRVYQEWLLKTVQYGMRTDEDVEIAERCHLFKMLFTLFSSSLADAHIRTVILYVVEATLNIPSGSITLVKCGVLPWLQGAFMKVQNVDDGDLKIAFIRAAAQLIDHAPSLVSMVISLLLKLPSAIEDSDLLIILQVADLSIGLISQDHLVKLLHVCQRVVDQQIVKDCYLQIGIPEEVTLKKLEATDSSEPVIKKESNTNSVERAVLGDLLKNVVLRWLVHHTRHLVQNEGL